MKNKINAKLASMDILTIQELVLIIAILVNMGIQNILYMDIDTKHIAKIAVIIAIHV
jgi:hypothetical protein